MRKILAEQGALRKKLLRLEMRVAELSDRTSADEDLELEPNPQERADSDTLSALSKAKLRRDGASGTPEMKGGGVASGKSDAENLEDEADDLAENLVPATLGSSWNVSEPETKELEIKLGSYWFVRIGIFMLLTGFVFLANYARVSVHDPLAKVGLLYGLAFGLLCAGLWLERRREEVRNFGRVLAAGGVAAVYYTTYAAYKVEALSVITSPYVAGLLLLVWTTVMIIVSHRKHSQTLALMGILLAYFTCVILDRATMFSLFSALLLACAGIVLLIVSRWVVVGFVSLGGTYLTFIYWRFPEVNTWLLGGAPDSTHFWPAQALLAGYWLLFTVATFATGREVLDGDKRSAFATVNNAAFLALFALGMHLHLPDSLGLFLLVAGVVFFGLSELAKRRFVQSGELYLGYQVAGVVAVAAGALFHFSGYALALVLSTASLVFLWFGKARRSDFLNASAYLLAAVGTIAAIPAGTEGLSWLAGFAQVGMLIMGGWYIRKWRENDQPRSRVP